MKSKVKKFRLVIDGKYIFYLHARNYRDIIGMSNNLALAVESVISEMESLDINGLTKLSFGVFIQIDRMQAKSKELSV